MKKERIILILLLTVIITFSAIPSTVWANDLPSVDKDDRFVLTETGNGDVDGFSMISGDGDLVIHIHNNDTPVQFEDGTDARERLEPEQTLAELLNNRRLIVSYSITTRSIPPQTSPSMVILMYEAVVPLPELVGSVDEQDDYSDVDQMDNPDVDQATEQGDDYSAVELNGEIVVKGEIIEALPAFVNSEGVVMVPIRAIAEKLGIDVNWDNATKGVRLGVAVNLWIGKDEYVVGRMAPISLGVAPILLNDRTFVPMMFFEDVISGYDVFVSGGRVMVEVALATGTEVPEGVEVHD